MGVPRLKAGEELQTLNNPAARLHALLTLLSRMPENNPARPCFAAALGVHNDDVYRVIQRLGEMVRLADRAEEQVRALPNVNLDLYLSWKRQVLQAFGGITLLGAIGTFIGPLKQENSLALERLGYCADLLFARVRRERSGSCGTGANTGGPRSAPKGG